MATPSPTAPVEDANELVLENLDMVRHIVNQVALRYPRHVDRDELCNAGTLGLVDASRRYDPTCGVPFARYAMIRIRGAIIDSTRSRDWATRGMRRGMRAARDAEDSFTAEHGREPSTVELAELLGMDVERLDEIRAAATSASLLHLDQRIGSPDGQDTTLGETIEERDADVLPEDTLEKREMTGTLRVAVQHLPEIQREVVERYYFEGEFLRSIAESMGVTEARVSQIRSEALNAIRTYFADSFDGVPTVDDAAPGRRARAVFMSAMAEHTTWRTRLDAADESMQDLMSAVPA